MSPAIVRCIGGPYDGHQVEGLVQQFQLAPSSQGGADPQPGGTYRYDREETAYRWTPSAPLPVDRVATAAPGDGSSDEPRPSETPDPNDARKRPPERFREISIMPGQLPGAW